MQTDKIASNGTAGKPAQDHPIRVTSILPTYPRHDFFAVGNGWARIIPWCIAPPLGHVGITLAVEIRQAEPDETTPATQSIPKPAALDKAAADITKPVTERTVAGILDNHRIPLPRLPVFG